MTTAIQKPQTELPIHHFSRALETDFHKVAELLPAHVDAARFKRMCVVAVAANEKLLDYDRKSLFLAITQAAQMGLEPDPNTGHVYFVPRAGKVACQVGYRGYIALAYRSEKVQSFAADVVREGDDFSFEKGTGAYLRHIPKLNSKAKVTHAWAKATLASGLQEFDVMSIEEVEAIKKRSAAGDRGPWSTDYNAMVKKTVIRRLMKLLPISIELQRAITIDEESDIPDAAATKGAPDALKKTLGIEVKSDDSLDNPDDLPEPN